MACSNCLPGLTEAAQVLLHSLHSGNLDQAVRDVAQLNEAISLPTSDADRRATAAMMLEARKIAMAHRAQTAEALRALGRNRHYAPERRQGKFSFEVVG